MEHFDQPELISEKMDTCVSNWFQKYCETFSIQKDGGWPDLFGTNLREYFNSQHEEKIRLLSLFSGGGGLDIGFHDAGFEIVECNELEQQFADTLVENTKQGARLEGSNIVCQDITEYDPNLKNIDFIIGGPPCQTFSAAGARAAGVNGTDDERGNLFLEYARILEKLSPKGFLFENVYRIVGAQGGKPWEKIQKAFQDLGYRLYWRILDSSDYGVPQFRERLFIVGLKEGTYKFPYPSHGPDSRDQRDYYTASKAVSKLKTHTPTKELGGRHGFLLKDIPPGLNYSFYTERMGHPEPRFGWRSKFSDYLYKADPDRPVRTIKAQGGQYTGPFSWKNRPFTIEELKRLQTFPDDYSVIGNRQKAIHQLGNSVPPQIARILALSIRKQVFNQDLPCHMELLPENLVLGFRKRKSQLTKEYAKKAAIAIAKLNTKENTHNDTRKGKDSFYVPNNFTLKLALNDEDDTYSGKYTLMPEKWNISVVDRNSKKQTYFIKINLQDVLAKTIGTNSIQINVASTKPHSILAAWKYLEYIVSTHSTMDDLIQLFGYYQYKQNYKIAPTFLDKSIQDLNIWSLWSKISNGLGVGKITSISDFELLYEDEQSNTLDIFTKLKSLGYEIRSHKTNKQIREGKFLIPYPFPTLSERSLQRFKNI